MNKHLANEPGTVGILNVGSGDTKLSFDPKNPAERIRAARIVKDMLRRGYALLIEHPAGSGNYTRALDFNEEVCEYVIADFDPIEADKADQEEERNGQQSEVRSGAPEGSVAQDAPRRRGRPPGSGRKAIPADGAKAVAVARIAGG